MAKRRHSDGALNASARIGMKALTDKHLAIFRRHMVHVIGIHADLSSDEIGFGGSGFGLVDFVETEPSPWQRQPHSFRIGLPPLGALLLTHEAD